MLLSLAGLVSAETHSFKGYSVTSIVPSGWEWDASGRTVSVVPKGHLVSAVGVSISMDAVYSGESAHKRLVQKRVPGTNRKNVTVGGLKGYVITYMQKGSEHNAYYLKPPVDSAGGGHLLVKTVAVPKSPHAAAVKRVVNSLRFTKG